MLKAIRKTFRSTQSFNMGSINARPRLKEEEEEEDTCGGLDGGDETEMKMDEEHLLHSSDENNNSHHTSTVYKGARIGRRHDKPVLSKVLKSKGSNNNNSSSSSPQKPKRRTWHRRSASEVARAHSTEAESSECYCTETDCSANFSDGGEEAFCKLCALDQRREENNLNSRPVRETERKPINFH